MTIGKTIALTRWTFVGKVMFLLSNMLSRLVIAFPPRSKRLLISWLLSPSAVILEPGGGDIYIHTHTHTAYILERERECLCVMFGVKPSTIQGPHESNLMLYVKYMTPSRFSMNGTCNIINSNDSSCLIFKVWKPEEKELQQGR